MQKEIKITVTAPEDCTEKQFEEWIKYCLGISVDIANDNPLWLHDLEADDVEIE